MKDFILKTWILICFIRNKQTLPTKSKISNPKMEYEMMSGAFIWEDEGLWDLKNHHLKDAFKYVISHRMNLVVNPENYVGAMRSKSFDKNIFEMAKKYFPNWIGFEKSRCSYNSKLEDRILRIKKVEKWKFEKMINN
ncbi:hypothetical protein HYN48_13890 [Flavobacterium magnum]|uniref:Uncharacterized protein n=1 Tax=Flavobacterium magnum TaxID=2162713 RepID=A0A2S0RIJ6_9FLAO|nr:hypothetical protein [Flavobacterium magnum]AWA31090.1 hypothetical protein HYN48_13890 [Flavobacterium magnum]